MNIIVVRFVKSTLDFQYQTFDSRKSNLDFQ